MNISGGDASGMSSPRDWGQRSGTLLAILRSQRVIYRAMSSSAAKDDITLQQFAVLGFLSRQGPIPMNRLSEELRVTPPNVTGVVDRLEKKELVKRVDDTSDRRRKMIQLTSKGRSLQERVRQGYSDSLQESLEALTSEEQETLGRLLEKFAREIANRQDRVAGPTNER